MILAQIQNVQPAFLKEFILVILGLVGGAAAVATVYGVLKKRRVEPQPLEIRTVADFVTRDFCGQLHAETAKKVDDHTHQLERLWESIESVREANEVAARARSAAIYEKIDEVRKELSAAQDQTRLQMAKGFADLERALGRLEGKINNRI